MLCLLPEHSTLSIDDPYGAIANLLNTLGKGSNLELFLVTPTLTILAIGFAVALGALAGVIPALRAARMDPVTALRTTN